MPFGVKKATGESVKLFNLDLHLAVIADVKDTLFRCGAGGYSRAGTRRDPLLYSQPSRGKRGALAPAAPSRSLLTNPLDTARPGSTETRCT
jgi:hypothetical protein